MFLRVWIFILLIKLLIGALIPLSADEAYYWVWTHFPQLSYFDHPPMVAWLLGVGNLLPTWAVRFPAIIFAHGMLWFWYLSLKAKIPDYKVSWVWYLICLLPLTGLGSVIVTPDLPLLFFWSAAFYFLSRGLEKPELKRNWLFLGVSLGLGFCAKYIVVLFPFFSLLYLLIEKQWKKVGFKNFFVVFFAAVIFSFPVWFWNMQNEWASFKFQLGGRYHESRFSWFYFLSTYSLSQIIIVFPTLLFLALKTWKEKSLRLLHWLSWGPIVFFGVMSLRGPVEPNWPAVSHLSIAALAVIGATHFRGLKIAAVFWSVLTTIALSLVITRTVPNELGKLQEPYQFEELGKVISNYQPLYASTYQMASQLWFQSQTPIFKLSRMSRYDFFDELEGSKPKEQKFYLARFKYEIELPLWLSKGYKIETVKSVGDNLEILEIQKQ